MKLFLTGLVIAAALMVLRNRSRQVAPPAATPATQIKGPQSRLVHFLAYGILLLMLSGVGYFLYMQWEDSYRVVKISVINSQTGNSAHYQARRGDIDGRSFRTLDGRDVSLADVERMELGGE